MPTGLEKAKRILIAGNNGYGIINRYNTLDKKLPFRIGLKSSEDVGRSLFKTKEIAYLKYPGKAIFNNSTDKQLLKLQIPTLPPQE